MNGGNERTCIRIIFPCVTCKSQFCESSNIIFTCREGRIANSSVRRKKKFCRYFTLLNQTTVFIITPKVDGMVFEICSIKWTVHIILKMIL